MKDLAIKSLIIFSLLGTPFSLKAQDQSEEEDVRMYEPLKLSGPRAGITYISGDLGKQMSENGINQYFSQFGWQFESRYFTT